MKTVSDFFSGWTEPLGWTLLNSLWQGLGILLITIIVLRFLPLRLSQARYMVACAGLGLLLAASTSTFIYLFNTSSREPLAHYAYSFEIPSGNISPITIGSLIKERLGYIILFLETNMPFILLAWITGTMVFSLRLLSGWWYVSKLKSEALEVDEEWSRCIQMFANQLKINRVVRLAQSAKIDTPLVIGFFKPIVLVPIGMFSGLSTEQIETIFVHELAHIKRHDYLINLVQSFIETIFFFNPFIWILSGIIRREREYCCDDAVLIKHGSALAYARALTQLEEVRLSRSAFVLSLAENKNQLLNRIKRLMEKSVKNYSGKDRLIPALLLVIGLICASWLSIRTDRQITHDQKLSKGIASDTVIKKRDKSASYYRKSITVYDEKGEPHEQVVDVFEGDELLKPMMAVPSIPDIAIPDIAWDAPTALWLASPIPEVDVISPIPSIPPVFEMNSIDAFNFKFDTIPARAFSFRADGEWKEFSKEFEKEFKEKFGDFYKTHGKDFEKLMAEMEEKFGEKFQHEYTASFHEAFPLEIQEKIQAELDQAQGLSMEKMQEIEEQAKLQQELALEHMEDLKVDQQRAMELAELQMQRHSEDVKVMEEQVKEIEVHMKAFERDLKAQLIEDGYIGQKDELKNIHWNDDGDIEINGKKIKEIDKKKYQKLHDRYFKDRNHIRYVE